MAMITNIEAFLTSRDEETFARLFNTLKPQLVAFFRARGCEADSEDLAQEVMLVVYRKSGQVRDRALFRAWVFAIARNALSRLRSERARGLQTVDLTELPERLVASSGHPAGGPAFEFRSWMAFLDSREREALTLRFIDEFEYHEIAAAQKVPVGTAQWRVFNAKKKLAPYLKRIEIHTARLAA